MGVSIWVKTGKECVWYQKPTRNVVVGDFYHERHFNVYQDQKDLLIKASFVYIQMYADKYPVWMSIQYGNQLFSPFYSRCGLRWLHFFETRQ
jgi:hypothetical protein